MILYKQISMNSMPTTYQVSDQRGFSLIEVLLSMVLLVLVSTVVIAMGSGTLVNAFSNQDRTRALSYTQEAVEQLRAIRDTDPQRIFIDPASDLWCPPSPPTSYYYFSLEGDLIDYYCGIPDPDDPGQLAFFQIDDTRFYRIIKARTYNADLNKQEIEVTTYYPEKSVYRSVSLVAYLTNWQ